LNITDAARPFSDRAALEVLLQLLPRACQPTAAIIRSGDGPPLPMPVLGDRGGVGIRTGFPNTQFVGSRKDVQAAIIERCGHYPAEERPFELAREIIEFFSDSTIDHSLSDSMLNSNERTHNEL